jgi:IS5 family transposase
VEFQIRDRLSFMGFLGLGIEDRVPDATTVWRFRERLKELDLMERLFNRFGDHLEAAGYQARSGQIVDATLVRVPIQRNRREENARIKAGEVPEDWSKAKRAQKDVDASRHKLVRNYRVTPANVHDSQVFDEVIDPDNEDPDVWADSAYRSEATEARLEGATYVSHLHEKGQAGQPLNDEQTQRNQERSRIRARVEQVFGFQENSLGGKRVQCAYRRLKGRHEARTGRETRRYWAKPTHNRHFRGIAPDSRIPLTPRTPFFEVPSNTHSARPTCGSSPASPTARQSAAS